MAMSQSPQFEDLQEGNAWSGPTEGMAGLAKMRYMANPNVMHTMAGKTYMDSAVQKVNARLGAGKFSGDPAAAEKFMQRAQKQSVSGIDNQLYDMLRAPSTPTKSSLSKGPAAITNVGAQAGRLGQTIGYGAAAGKAIKMNAPTAGLSAVSNAAQALGNISKDYQAAGVGYTPRKDFRAQSLNQKVMPPGLAKEAGAPDMAQEKVMNVLHAAIMQKLAAQGWTEWGRGVVGKGLGALKDFAYSPGMDDAGRIRDASEWAKQVGRGIHGLAENEPLPQNFMEGTEFPKILQSRLKETADSGGATIFGLAPERIGQSVGALAAAGGLWGANKLMTNAKQRDVYQQIRQSKELQGHPEEKVRDAYRMIARYSPTLATDPIASATMAKSILSFDGLTHKDVIELSNAEQAIQRNAPSTSIAGTLSTLSGLG